MIGAIGANYTLANMKAMLSFMNQIKRGIAKTALILLMIMNK
jgi:hypothetical protein